MELQPRGGKKSEKKKKPNFPKKPPRKRKKKANKPGHQGIPKSIFQLGPLKESNVKKRTFHRIKAKKKPRGTTNILRSTVKKFQQKNQKSGRSKN